jgi:hypothetical protein
VKQVLMLLQIVPNAGGKSAIDHPLSTAWRTVCGSSLLIRRLNQSLPYEYAPYSLVTITYPKLMHELSFK